MGNLCAPAAEPPTPNPADDEAYSPPLGAPAEGNPIGENTRTSPNVTGPDPHPSLDASRRAASIWPPPGALHPSEAETPGHPTP